MTDQKSDKCCESCQCHRNRNSSAVDVFYMMGFIGAAIYFIGKAATLGAGVVGFFKAIVWPVFFVFEALRFLLG